METYTITDTISGEQFATVGDLTEIAKAIATRDGAERAELDTPTRSHYTASADGCRPVGIRLVF